MENLDPNLVLVFVGTLVGVLLGGGGVAMVLQRANQDTKLKDTTEELLAGLVPAEIVEQLNDLTKIALNALPVVGDAIEFVESVTDGDPNLAPELLPDTEELASSSS